jgi:hypothetical protein
VFGLRCHASECHLQVVRMRFKTRSDHCVYPRQLDNAPSASLGIRSLDIDVFTAVIVRATENGVPPGDAVDFWDTISVEELQHIDANGPPTPLLDTINYPMHMKNLSVAQLRQLCKEIRADLIHTVSQTGGHLGSSLGVVELTVAMHHVFNCPADKFIFDVGHQAYVHKMLTGRRSRMGTIRQYGGLSGKHSTQLHTLAFPHGAMQSLQLFQDMWVLLCVSGVWQ